LPASELPESPASATTWEKSQSLENGPNDHEKVSRKHARAV
jgi:hypothetical protein